jgi:hypothetical protein
VIFVDRMILNYIVNGLESEEDSENLTCENLNAREQQILHDQKIIQVSKSIPSNSLEITESNEHTIFIFMSPPTYEEAVKDLTRQNHRKITSKGNVEKISEILPST